MIESFTCVYSPRVSVWEFGGLLETEKIGKPNKRNPCVATEEARKWTVVLITLIDGNLCSPKKTSRDNYYSLSRRCVLSFSSCFFSSFFFYLFCVSRTSGSDSFSLRTHTHHLSLDLSLPPFVFLVFFFSRDNHTPTITVFCLFVCFFFIHRRASVFSPLPFFSFPNRFVRFISFIKSVAIWIYTQQSADTLLRYSGRVSGEFLVFALDGECVDDGVSSMTVTVTVVSITATVTVMVSMTMTMIMLMMIMSMRRSRVMMTMTMA